MGSRAISEIQIYEALIGNTCVLRYRLEIAYRLLIKANGDLLLQLRSVRILSRISEVVFFAHMSPFISRTSIREHLPCEPR